jgi:cytochrome bd-type quinol oxidase subunit 2
MSERGSRGKDIGGGIISLLLIVVGAVVLYDTTSYGDADSAVFPRTVAIVLMAVSAISALRAFLSKRGDPEMAPPTPGSWPRRLLLPVIMLASVFAMRGLGFLPAMLIMFTGLLLVANHDGWSGRRAMVYGASAFAVVLLFYLVFRYWLKVPLP